MISFQAIINDNNTVYDKNNIYYLLSREGAFEALCYIANKKNKKASLTEIQSEFGYIIQDWNMIFENFSSNKFIKFEKSQIHLTFPIFFKEYVYLFKKELPHLIKILVNLIKQQLFILDKTISNFSFYNMYSIERWRFHIIYDFIFNGVFKSFFISENIFKNSKLIFLEQDPLLLDFKNQLTYKTSFLKSYNYKFNCTKNNFKESDKLSLFWNIEERAVKNASYINLYEKLNKENLSKIDFLISKLIYAQSNNMTLILNKKDLSLYKSCCFLKNMGYITISNYNEIKLCTPLLNTEDLKLIKSINNDILSNSKEFLINISHSLNCSFKSILDDENLFMKNFLFFEIYNFIVGGTLNALIIENLISNPKNFKNSLKYIEKL